MSKNKNKKIRKKSIKTFDGLNEHQKMALVKDSKWLEEKEYRIPFIKEEAGRGLVIEDKGWFFNVEIIRIYLGTEFGNAAESDSEYTKYCKEIREECEKTGNEIEIKQLVKSKDKYALIVKNSEGTME